MSATHSIHVWGEPCRCGVPGHQDTTIKCSCGWEKTIRHRRTTDSEVQTSILYHRIVSIEKDLGIKFSVKHGKE